MVAMEYTKQSSRKGGIRMMQDDTNILQEDEPLLLLDPHQASSTANRPFQKGGLIVSYPSIANIIIILLQVIL